MIGQTRTDAALHSFPRTAVVVLNYKQDALTLECLASLSKSRYPNLDVILVDNESTGGIMARVRQLFPGIITVANERNEGFAKGCNQGTEIALSRRAEYVFLLNNDAIVEDDTISELVNALEHNPSVAIVGPVIYDYNKRQQVTSLGLGGRIDLLRCLVKDARPSTRDWDPNVQVEFVSGAALMVRADFIKARLFDPDYFIYFEDAELNLRAVRAGHQCVVISGAKVYHRVSQAFGYLSDRSFYYFSRGRMIFASKNIGNLRFTGFLLYLTGLYFPGLVVYSVFKHRRGLLRAFSAGTLAGLKTMRDRRKEVCDVARTVLGLARGI